LKAHRRRLDETVRAQRQIDLRNLTPSRISNNSHG
jgi:hypothetical protein